jgi:hypothetical protein
MGGRRRLVGGYSVWLPDHSRTEGYIARRYLKAGEEIAGSPNGSEHLRIEIRQYAIAGVAYELAARQHAELVDHRARKKGRRPSLKTVERAPRRLGLASITVRDATARLEALTADQRRAADPLEQMLHDSVAPRRP